MSLTKWTQSPQPRAMPWAVLKAILGYLKPREGKIAPRGRQDRAKMDMACILPMKNGYF